MQKRVDGFTLLELLVVMSIMAMLMSILMPSLTKAKEQARRIDCLAHLNQLTIGWMMYASSNSDKLCSPDTAEADKAVWADVWDPADGIECGVELSIKAGVLWPYAQHVKLYECQSAPMHNSIHSFQNRIRDYSLSRMMGYPVDSSWWDDEPVVPFRRLSSIKRPGEKLVFLDADGGIMGRNSVGLPVIAEAFMPIAKDGDVYKWKFMRWENGNGVMWNVMSSRHDKGFNLSYGDGHVGYYKFRDRRTVRFCVDVTDWDYEQEASKDNSDLDFMTQILRGPE
jgi:prepilin-type N-terminal cleavage/methylation domain-containing protein/prepilin-type processing-associated H-X9-DG protein